MSHITPMVPVDSTGADATDTSNHSIKVSVVSGGGTGGTASSFGAGFPATGTAVGVKDNTGNMGWLETDASGNLKVTSSAGSGLEQATDAAWDGTAPITLTFSGTPGAGHIGLSGFGPGDILADFEGTLDNTVWFALDVIIVSNGVSNLALATQASTEGTWYFNATGLKAVRVRKDGTSPAFAGVSVVISAGTAGPPPIQAIIPANPSGLTVAQGGTQGPAGTPWATALQDYVGNTAALATAAPVAGDTGLVVRNIPSGTQAISAVALPLPTGAATAVLQTQPGVDIGDVTVNNGAGVSAVNVQDGGNSLTIDAANLDVALSTRLKPADTLTKVSTVDTITNVVKVDDNGASLTVDNPNLDVALSTRLKPADTLAAVTTVGTITNVVHVDDNAGSLTIDNANLDATISSLLKPADTLTKVATVDTITNAVTVVQPSGAALHVNIDSMPAVSASSAADVLAPDGDAGYTVGDLGKNLTQTDDGRLRTIIAALVSDAVQSYQDGGMASLSLTTEGRLRVATASESNNFTPWGGGETWGSDDAHINGSHPLCAW